MVRSAHMLLWFDVWEFLVEDCSLRVFCSSILLLNFFFWLFGQVHFQSWGGFALMELISILFFSTLLLLLRLQCFPPVAVLEPSVLNCNPVVNPLNQVWRWESRCIDLAPPPPPLSFTGACCTMTRAASASLSTRAPVSSRRAWWCEGVCCFPWSGLPTLPTCTVWSLSRWCCNRCWRSPMESLSHRLNLRWGVCSQ